jgi:hypothetical protein
MDTAWLWVGGLSLLGFLGGFAIAKALKKRTTVLTIDPFITFAASLVAVSCACSVAIIFAPTGGFARDLLSGLGFSAAWIGTTISGWSGMRLGDRRCIAVFISSLPPLAESIWRLLNKS